MSGIRASLRLAFSRLSIRTELIVIIILFSLTPALILSVLYYARLDSLVKEKVSTYATGIVNQSAESVQGLMRQVDVIWRQVVDIAALTDYLYSSSVRLNADHIDAIMKDEVYLNRLKRSFLFISNIYLVGVGDRVISTATNADYALLLGKPWFREARSSEIPGIRMRVIQADYADRSAMRPAKVLSVVSRITPYGLMENSIVLVIDFDYGLIFEHVDASLIGPGSWMMIYDEGGRILYHPDPALVGTGAEQAIRPGIRSEDLFRPGLIEQGDSILLCRRIERVGWVLCQMPLVELTGELAGARNLYLAALLALIGLTIAMSFFAVNRITRPIFRMIRGMSEVRKGDFSARVEESGNKEFLQLVVSFNRMQAEITSLMARVTLKERETVRAELLALQFQINPHFLYNTMDVLRGMAYEKRFEDIAGMTESLGRLFRYAKSGRDASVTLAQELEHLSDYIQIQKHRFGDRFSFASDIAEDCLGAVVIRFMLQPIVENAFQHGIEKREARGLIELGARREGGDLIVVVSDNGAGMGAESLQKIRSGLRAVTESENTGIGIANVHNRIRLLYGEAYGLSVDSEADSGTRVTIRLPFATGEGVP